MDVGGQQDASVDGNALPEALLLDGFDGQATGTAPCRPDTGRDRVRIEDTICDPSPVDTGAQQVPAAVWTVVDAASHQHHPKLISSAGYSYNVKRTYKNGTVDWQCCRRERRAGVMCRATVKQNGDMFIPGASELIATVQLTASLQQLVDYVQRQWIDGRFPPTNWSVYMKTVRTNNDTEGTTAS